MSNNKQNLTMSPAELLFSLTPAQAKLVESRVGDRLCNAFTGTREDDCLDDRINDCESVAKFYRKVHNRRGDQYTADPTKRRGILFMQAKYAVWWLNQWIEDLRSSADLAGRV